MTPAYVVVQVQINDPETFQKYTEEAIPTIGQYGGEALVVDNHPEVIEGEWHGPRTVVLRFDSKEAARTWYDSPEYQEAVKLRFASADSKAIVAEGMA
jgi:uncharacterized protein (DUF1330 family)